MTERLCIFVCSSDNTHDVFEATHERLLQTWPLTAIPAYVGTNSRSVPAPLQAVRAPASGWRTELLQQIRALPEQVEHIALVLDDFFFHKAVQLNTLQRFSSLLSQEQGDYLRLKPVERALIPSMFRRLRRLLGLLPDIERLVLGEPYYSSLQVAIWRRAYLIERLDRPGNIWAFEHEAPPGSRHFAVTAPCLDYEHLVEKGKWYRFAPDVLQVPASSAVFRRGFEEGMLKNFKAYHRVKFMLVGYTVFRLRRCLSSRVKP
jgi:hypothetical protein